MASRGAAGASPACRLPPQAGSRAPRKAAAAVTSLCDDVLRHLYELRNAAKKDVASSDVSKLARLFDVTENNMIVECGTLEQGELIVWDRTPHGSVKISKGGLKYCDLVLDLSAF